MLIKKETENYVRRPSVTALLPFHYDSYIWWKSTCQIILGDLDLLSTPTSATTSQRSISTLYWNEVQQFLTDITLLILSQGRGEKMFNDSCETRNGRRITISGRSRSSCKGKRLCFKNSRWKNGKDKGIDCQNFRSCSEKCHCYYLTLSSNLGAFL